MYKKKQWLQNMKKDKKNYYSTKSQELMRYTDYTMLNQESEKEKKILKATCRNLKVLNVVTRSGSRVSDMQIVKSRPGLNK